MKNISIKNSVRFLFICVSLSIGVMHAQDQTLKQRAQQAALAVGKKSKEVWHKIKSFFLRKKQEMPRYKSSIVPLEVKPQYGLECGLCAVENGANVYTYLMKATGKERAGSFEAAASKWYTGSWRKAVMKKFGRQDNLDDVELVYVAQELAKLPREAYTIHPSIKQFNLEFLTEDERKHIIDTITTLREKVGAKHLFILGNMSNQCDEYGNVYGVEGHWISTVVERTQDGFTYYTMDTMSMNCPSAVEALQTVIEKHPLK